MAKKYFLIASIALALISGGLALSILVPGLPSDEVGTVIYGAMAVGLLWICGLSTIVATFICIWNNKTLRRRVFYLLIFSAIGIGIWVGTDGLSVNPFTG